MGVVLFGLVDAPSIKGSAEPTGAGAYIVTDSFWSEDPPRGTHTDPNIVGGELGDNNDLTYAWARQTGQVPGYAYNWRHEWVLQKHPTGFVDYVTITLRHAGTFNHGSATIQPSIAGTTYGTAVQVGAAWTNSSWSFPFAPSGDRWTKTEFDQTGIGFFVEGNVSDLVDDISEARVAEMDVDFYGPANTTLTLGTFGQRVYVASPAVTYPVLHAGLTMRTTAGTPSVSPQGRSVVHAAGTVRQRVADVRADNGRIGWSMVAPSAPIAIVYAPLQPTFAYTARNVYEATLAALRPAGTLGDRSMTTAATVVTTSTAAYGTLTVTMPNIGNWTDMETMISGITPYAVAWRGDYGTATKTYGSAWLGFSVHGTQMLGAVTIPTRGTVVPEVQASPYVVAGSYFTRSEDGAPWQSIDPISIDAITVMQTWSGTAGTAALCVHEGWIDLRGYSLHGTAQTVFEGVAIGMSDYDADEVKVQTTESASVVVGQHIEGG